MTTAELSHSRINVIGRQNPEVSVKEVKVSLLSSFLWQILITDFNLQPHLMI